MRKGFTLVELLVAMGIMAVMMTVVSVISIQGTLNKNHDLKRKSDLESMRSALELYKNVNHSYPKGCSWFSGISGYAPTITNFISPVPSDSPGYLYASNNCGSGNGTSYALWATMNLPQNQDMSLFGIGVTQYDSGQVPATNYKVANPP